MKALIFNNTVIDIQETEFEVHNDMYWIDCDDKVKHGFLYINGNLVDNSSYSQKETDVENLTKAIAYLLKTDYKVLPDYDGDITGILEARAEARTLIRSLKGNV